MFTVKLIRGSRTVMREADSVEVVKLGDGRIEIIPVKNGVGCTGIYVGTENHHWPRAIIENSAGKTTQIIDAPSNVE